MYGHSMLCGPDKSDQTCMIGMELLDKWGSVASIAGLAVALVGFGGTLYKLWRTSTAAEEARKAANETRQEFRQHKVIGDLHAAKAGLSEIRRLQRAEAWHQLPERYSAIRELLVALRRQHTSLTDDQASDLQSAIQYLRDLETHLESVLDEGESGLNKARLNRLITDHIDRVHEILLDFYDANEVNDD